MYETNCTDCRRAFVSGEARWQMTRAGGERMLLCVSCVELMRDAYEGLRAMDAGANAKASASSCVQCGDPVVGFRMPDGRGYCARCARELREPVDMAAPEDREHIDEGNVPELPAHVLEAIERKKARGAASRVSGLTDDARARELKHLTAALQACARIARAGTPQEKLTAWQRDRGLIEQELRAAGLWEVAAPFDGLVRELAQWMLSMHARLTRQMAELRETGAVLPDGMD